MIHFVLDIQAFEMNYFVKLDSSYEDGIAGMLLASGGYDIFVMGINSHKWLHH